tara:strand:- start:338 stop:592 length:255 start_codon:yes stop_codon:yes gene_type:complete
MKLYLLEQDENHSEGAIMSCVVVADSEEQAQQVHPFTDWDRVEIWTYNPEDVKVTYLGEAREDLEKVGFSDNVNNVVCIHRCYS